MKKVTFLLIAVFAFCWQNHAQFTFPTEAGPINVVSGTPDGFSPNDAGNTAGVPSASYDSFTITLDWTNGFNAWSSEAEATITTAAGSVTIDPPTSGGADTGDPTSLVFSGSLAGLYDPDTDGTLDIQFDTSWGGSDANFANIEIVIFPVPTCTEATITSATIVPDCGTDTFSVEVVVSDAGDADFFLDDVNGFTPFVGAGTYDLGPFPVNSAAFSIALIHTDEDCNINLEDTYGPFEYFCTPDNDECVDAETIACGNTYTGNTTAANPESPDPGTCTTTAGTGGAVWYTFTGANSNDAGATVGSVGDEVTFDLSLSSFDTKIRVFEGSCGALTCVGGDDDGGTGATSLFSFDAIVGTTYYVLVHGYLANEGAYSMEVTCDPPPVLPPNCDAALTSVTTDFPIDGTLTWSAATGDPTGYNIAIGSTSGGTDIAVEDVGNTTSYAPTGLTYSDTFYVIITPYNANGPATGCTEQTFTVEDAPPAGTVCNTAIAVTPGTITGTTIVDGTGSSQMAPTGDDSAWYVYTATADGTIDVSSCLGGSDTDLSIGGGACGAFTDVINNDDACDLGNGDEYASEILGYPVVTGQNYYIEWSDEWEEGPFDWTLTFTPAPSCLPVSDVTVDSVTIDSVTLSWTANSGETAWEVVIQADGTGEPGAADGSGTDTTNNPYTSPSTLTPETAYEVWVRAECIAGTDFGDWVGPLDFTTPCDAFTPDYTEDFATFLDGCWDEANGGDLVAGPASVGTGSWVADGFVNSGTTGAAKINFFGAGPDVDWLITPVFDLSADGYEVLFDSSIVDWNGTTLTDTFNAGDIVQFVYSTDGTNWQVLYDLIANIPAAAGETITVDLTGITSSTVQFAFFSSDDATDTSGRDLDIFVDNFEVRTIPLCPEVSAIAVPTTGTTSADITWTGGGVESAWEVAVVADGAGTPDTADGTGADTATESYTAMGLSPATAYDVYVRAECTAGTVFGSWIGPVSFTTACDAFNTFPYSEGFEGGVPPTCWTSFRGTNGEGTGFDWTTSGTANSGSQAAFVRYENVANSAQDWLVTPEFDFSALTAPELSFFARESFGIEYGSVHSIQVSTTTNDIAEFSSVQAYTEADFGTAYEEFVVDLSAYAGQSTVYIAFVMENDDGDSWFIDDVLVREAPMCTEAVVDTAEVVEDCGAGTFTVEVEFTSVGDATDITDGTDTFAISGTSATAGPYPVGTTVNLDVVHSDGACDFTIPGDFIDACPPANDDFANAIPLVCGTTVFGNTTAATLDENDAPDGVDSDTDSPNVWYSYFGNGQTVSLDTCLDGTDYDTEILVFTGTSGNLTFVAEGYDECDGTNSDYLAQTSFVAEAGIQYWISVEGWNATSIGSFEMSVTCTGDEDFVYNMGTWTPSDPTGTTTPGDIYIAAGNATMTGDTDCNSFTVRPGAGAIVPSGASVTTTAGMTLESTSTSYSSLILDGIVNGTMNYERHVNINGSGSTGSNDLVSAPLTGQQFNDFATANPNLFSNTAGDLFLFGPFDKTIGDFVTYADTETQTLDASVGYRAATEDNSTLTFTGTAENGPIANNITNSGPTRQEWNLVGNPYPSYMNVQDFLTHEVAPGVINLHLFDVPTAAIYGYDGSATNGWTIYNMATTTPSTVITPGQGFFVSADATNVAAHDLEFTPAMRSTGNGDDFIVGRNAQLSYFILNMSTNNKSYNTDFYFNANASQGFDVGYDAGLWAGEVPNFALYSHLVQDNNGVPMALQALNGVDITDVTIPLGVEANQGEQLRFSIEETTLPASVNVYLEDNVAGTVTLLNDTDYVLTPNSDLSGTGRFFLRYTDDALSTIENSIDKLNIFALNTTDELVVSGQLYGNTILNLYDIQGRNVLSTTLDETKLQNRIDVANINAGVYIVTVQSNSQEKTKKVILE